MEFTQETIDALSVNEVEIMKKIAEELNIRVQQVSAVISLVEEGCTIPFISRYRKEKHDNLDEVQVRDCDHLYKSYHNLEDRRLEIVKGVFAQGKLTETLYNAVMSATTMTALEDLWAPFKKKKKTRGMIAAEKGLEPLADFILADHDDGAVEKEAEKFIKRYMMGYEFLNNKTRYCLWLVDAKPNDLVQMPLVMERVKKVKAMRESSSFEQTRKMADTPTLFRETFNPPSFIAIPVVSSERRRYIPMGYLDDNTIPGNKLFMIENAEYFHFGVLESNVHMAWMRAVAGRLKSDYSYSKDIVYNCFVWPELNESTKKAISETAKGILEARLLYADSSLANLYDETIMPIELRKAHQKNDMAVMDAYGFYHTDENGKKIWFKEDETVAALMQMYQDLIKKG